jgi:3-deoxy-D-manno-octulosonate 8-phosphate phosphatase (KDO 8-P phosphatase)
MVSEDKPGTATDPRSSILDPRPSIPLADRCAAIALLIVDVDGVLTDGGIIYGDDGVELKQFHVRDGSGLKLWQRAGKRAALISGRQSRVVEVRAAELGIAPVVQGAADKLPAYRQILADSGLRPEQVCFVGDDVPDLPVLRNCGLAVAVADACPEVRADAHYVTRAPGGRGAVRETVELILRGQGLWQDIVERYRNEKL